MNIPQISIPKHLRRWAIVLSVAVLINLLVFLIFTARVRQVQKEAKNVVQAQVDMSDQLTRMTNRVNVLERVQRNHTEQFKEGAQNKMEVPSSGKNSEPPTADIMTPEPKPTRTPRPTPIPAPEPTDTPPDTVLEPQRIWREAGVELVLLDDYDFKIDEKQLHVNFKFKNDTGQDLLVQYGIDDISAVDDLGNRLSVLGIWHQRSIVLVNYYNEIEKLLAPGDEIRNTDVDHPLRIEMDTGIMCEVSEITLIFTNISRIGEAKWRIPVNLC